MKEQINGNTKRSRYNKIMKEQAIISNNLLKEKIGKNYEIIVEDVTDDEKYFVGRTIENIPDEDGLVYIEITKENSIKVIINEFCRCKIIDIDGYDLIAEVI